MTKFRALIVSKLQNEQAKLTALSTEVFWHLHDEFLSLEKRLAYDDEKLAPIGRAHPECQRLQTIPGIGPINATAILAAISDATHFKNGRQFAAWLRLVPVSTRRAASHGALGSAHAATAICVDCSCMELEPRSAGST